MFDFTIDLNSIFILVGFVIAGVELYYIRESNAYHIEQDYQQRYNVLIANRGDLEAYFRDLNFDLTQLKIDNEQDYKKIVAWERQYIKLCFQQWLEAHRRHRITNDVRQDWDANIEKAMTFPAHQQIWQDIIRSTEDFSRHKKNFHRYIDGFIAKANKKSKSKEMA